MRVPLVDQMDKKEINSTTNIRHSISVNFFFVLIPLFNNSFICKLASLQTLNSQMENEITNETNFMSKRKLNKLKLKEKLNAVKT